MGYTRYWVRTDKKVNRELVDAINAILSDCRNRGIIIKNGWGEGSPIVNEDEGILFNGDASTGLDHETFYITNNEQELNNWEFYKTARKPYDYAVRRALEEAERLGFVKDVSDDGDNSEIISDADYLVRKGERSHD